jgi:hypothetical protein
MSLQSSFTSIGPISSVSSVGAIISISSASLVDESVHSV